MVEQQHLGHGSPAIGRLIGGAGRTVVQSGGAAARHRPLQRCAFDDTVPLERMESDGPLAGYLAGCRGADGGWAFDHEVHLITWTRSRTDGQV